MCGVLGLMNKTLITNLNLLGAGSPPIIRPYWSLSLSHSSVARRIWKSSWKLALLVSYSCACWWFSSFTRASSHFQIQIFLSARRLSQMQQIGLATSALSCLLIINTLSFWVYCVLATSFTPAVFQLWEMPRILRKTLEMSLLDTLWFLYRMQSVVH